MLPLRRLIFRDQRRFALSMSVKRPNRRAQNRLLNDTEDSIDLRRNRFNLFIHKYETIDTDYYGNDKHFLFI